LRKPPARKEEKGKENEGAFCEGQRLSKGELNVKGDYPRKEREILRREEKNSRGVPSEGGGDYEPGTLFGIGAIEREKANLLCQKAT